LFDSVKKQGNGATGYPTRTRPSCFRLLAGQNYNVFRVMSGMGGLGLQQLKLDVK
jgi:hypothetical protein